MKQELLGRTNALLCLYDTDRIVKDASTNSCCGGNVFTEPLPSRDKGIHTHTARERERARERETTFKGGGKKHFCLSPVLKVPKQCPLALVVEVCLTEGEALGSE
jgi:hypothetical protein